MFSRKPFFSLVVAVLLTVSVISIGAQESNTAYSDDEYLDYGEADEELVIIAGRTPEPASIVPAQVTVITADDIAQSGATSVVDVLETVPGVRFSGAMAGAGSEVISMRGFGENSYGRVLVLVDGNKINDPDMKVANWNAIPLSAIERIEVLDGSASVQYGNNAVGGVINIITKKGGTRQTLISILGGSFFNNRESISHFQPVSWGNFSIAAEHYGTQGYRERQVSETANINLGSTVFIGDTMQLAFYGFFSYLYYQLPGGLSKTQFDDDPRQASPYSPDDENNEYHFGGGVSFRWFPTENVEFMLPLSYRGKSIKSDLSWSFSDKSVHSAEARPQGSVIFGIAGMPLRLLGGVDLYYTRLDADIDQTPPTAYTISEWVIGPYITVRFSPLENLSFSAGARFDTAFIRAENKAGDANGDKTFHAFVYDAGIVYNPLDELKVYAKFARLFRYPFVDELAQVAGWDDKFNTDLKPEKGFNTEIGAAWQFEEIISLTTNFFFMQLEDEIAYIGNPPDSRNVNQDKTRRFGANVGFSFTPIEWVSLDASYSWVNAFFADGNDKDKKVPLVPQHKIYGNLMVHLPFGLSFGPDIEYVNNCYYSGDFGNEAASMDSYFLLGARVRFVRDINENQLAFQITAKNLLNTKYAAYGTAYYDSWVTNEWQYSLYPADGFSLNISVQYRF